MSDLILKLTDVRKELSIKSDGQVVTNVILPSISLEIKKGEFTAITGPSGSGKTTLLYLLGGLDKPDFGKIFLDGDDITAMNEEALAELRNRKLGFVYQFHFLLPEFSAMENVTMPMLARGKYTMTQARKKAKELLDLVGMSDKYSNKPNQLSGGQQQRVSIARALANSPVLILADEPTGNLDTKNSGMVYELFKKLNKETGQTIVVVTHDPSFAVKCDRELVLVDGEIISDMQKTGNIP